MIGIVLFGGNHFQDPRSPVRAVAMEGLILLAYAPQSNHSNHVTELDARTQQSIFGASRGFHFDPRTNEHQREDLCGDRRVRENSVAGGNGGDDEIS